MNAPSQPPRDSDDARSEVGDATCRICGLDRPTEAKSPVCDRCCREFVARGAVAAEAARPTLLQATRFRWITVVVAAGFITQLVAIGVASTIHQNAVPELVANGLKGLQFVLLAAALWTCVKLDTIVRHFPSLPRPPRSRMHAISAGLEDRAPGAALAMLAILLPWVIGIRDRSLMLLIVYALLSFATITTAAALWSRMRSYERMRTTCQADSAHRLRAWGGVRVHRRGVIAVAVWAAIPCLIAALPLVGIGRPYPQGGPGLYEFATWRVVSVSLYLAALLWFIAFIDATRSLRRWIPNGA